MLKKFIFDSPPKTFLEKVVNIFAFVLLNLFYLFCIILFLKQIDPDIFKQEYNPFGETPSFGYMFFMGCIWAPIWEEAAFRLAPITIAKYFGKEFIPPVVIISSVLFGWGHGNGPTSLLIQGVSGLILSGLYIKNNYSYLSSVTAHFIWNLLTIFVFSYFFGH